MKTKSEKQAKDELRRCVPRVSKTAKPGSTGGWELPYPHYFFALTTGSSVRLSATLSATSALPVRL